MFWSPESAAASSPRLRPLAEVHRVAVAEAVNAAVSAVNGNLRIGQLARTSGVPCKTLRYYDDVGLLHPAGRTASGYRLYGDDAIDRLRFVRKAQRLGLSLADIGSVLKISDEGRIPCGHVAALVDRQLAHIDDQLRQLRSLRRDLLGLRSKMSAAQIAGTAAGQQGCPCME